MNQSKRKLTPPRIFGKIFGFFIVVFCAQNLWTFYITKKISQESVNWPTVKATVINSEIMTVVSSSQGNRTGATGQRQGRRSTTNYHLNISYKYSMKGRKIFGPNPRLPLWFSSWTEADKVLKQYPKGSEIAVRYNPEKITQTVIEPTTPPKKTIFIILFSIFITVGLILIVFI